MPFVIMRGGKLTEAFGVRGRFDTRADAGAAIQEHGDASGGYDVEEVSADVWHPLEARALRATARRMFTDHGHGSDMSRMTRENCGACVLGGYEPRGGFGDGYRVATDGPNYANWQRDYVQAGRDMPSSWRDAFARELRDTDNALWRDALLRDIRTFGAGFVGAPTVFDPSVFGL